MQSRKLLLLIASLYLLYPLQCVAQEFDLGLWTGINVEKKFKKSFAVHLNTQLRLGENLSVTRSYLGELGVSYAFNKHWEITGYYRYTGRRKFNEEILDHYYRTYHRFYADVSYDRKIWKLKLDYRLRYQHQFRDDDTSMEADDSYLRNKLEISYPNKTRLVPYLSTDIFYQLGTGFEQMRNKAGVEIILDRHQRIDFYGFTDYQLIDMQKNQLILGLMYKVKF
ncbi:DUF2490 domain-containing protein [Rhodocytophaga aerolata]|uniref:DUF2490 domain-containing protein n=1 Tax=Rhodocytophaga aerolata TaxID=455078 RepID=A0ABT8REP1_9BACT|nr:DUF2490 domain-containing protein [Rhodocytophaga aerolata]MDO1450569.1 DUF2490 domain-containing protein [Rhodocytophaga aerolata]